MNLSSELKNVLLTGFTTFLIAVTGVVTLDSNIFLYNTIVVLLSAIPLLSIIVYYLGFQKTAISAVSSVLVVPLGLITVFVLYINFIGNKVNPYEGGAFMRIMLLYGIILATTVPYIIFYTVPIRLFYRKVQNYTS